MEPDKDTWILAGRGDTGDGIDWDPTFASIGDVSAALAALEDEPDGTWLAKRAFDERRWFRRLAKCDFPPLYLPRDLEELDGFLVISTQPEDDRTPGTSFDEIRVYVERRRCPKVIAEFTQLLRRLTDLDALRRGRGLTPDLMAAYRATDYVVLATPEVSLRVGTRSAACRLLLASHGASSGLFVTAWNPFSQTRTKETNQRRNRALLSDIQRRGLAWLPAEGRDPTGQWKPEPSYFVFDAGEDSVDETLIEFEQNAAVIVGKDGGVALALHPRYR